MGGRGGNSGMDSGAINREILRQYEIIKQNESKDTKEAKAAVKAARAKIKQLEKRLQRAKSRGA